MYKYVPEKANEARCLRYGAEWHEKKAEEIGKQLKSEKNHSRRFELSRDLRRHLSDYNLLSNKAFYACHVPFERVS